MKKKLLIVIGIIILMGMAPSVFASEAESDIGIFFTENDSLSKEVNVDEKMENNKRLLPKTSESSSNRWSFLGSVVLCGIFLTKKKLKLEK